MGNRRRTACLNVSLGKLGTATIELLRRRGFSQREAEVIAGYCVAATAEGHFEHGIGALWILDRQKELVPGRGRIRTVCSNEGKVFHIHASGFLGFLPAQRAVHLLRLQIQKQVLPALAVIHSRGFRGRLGHLVRPLAEEGGLALAMATTAHVARIRNNAGRALGTNPIAFGIPAARAPLVLDLGTTTKSYAKAVMDKVGGRQRRSVELEDLVELRPWGGRRGAALSVAVEAFVSVASTLPVAFHSEWGLVLVVVPARQIMRLDGDSMEWWRRMLGVRILPGERSVQRSAKARSEGATLPFWLWYWLLRS